MNINSKYFDSIRIKPGEDTKAEAQSGTCQWPGCRAEGTHRAPRGREYEGQYLRFCFDHVREYNKNYNYFQGMSDEETWSYQKTAATGHRPTWRFGVNAWSPNGRTAGNSGGKVFSGFGVNDTYDVLDGARIDGEARTGPTRNRPVRALERRSLDTLDLDETATGERIKARYKELVKRHHPDANGGDRGSEDRLREIIQAYKHLKSVGFC